MPTWFNDASVVVTIVFGALGIVTAVVIYLLQRSKKELTYEVLSEIPLLSVNDLVAKDISIAYRKQPVTKLHLLELRFSNSGNLPIKPTDFIEELSFCLPIETIANSWIINEEITKSSPKGLRVPFTKTQISNVIEFTPILLNKGDSFTIRFLIAGYEGKYDITGRIIGVKDIKKKAKISLLGHRIISLMIVMIYVIGAPSLLLRNQLHKVTLPNTPFYQAMAIGVALLGIIGLLYFSVVTFMVDVIKDIRQLRENGKNNPL